MDILVIAHLIILFFLIATALATLLSKDLLDSIIIFSGYSFCIALTYLILRAPDVAMTEAAVGAGATSMIFIAALSKTSRRE